MIQVENDDTIALDSQLFERFDVVLFDQSFVHVLIRDKYGKVFVSIPIRNVG